MAASTREEIKIGAMTIRFLLEGEQSDGSVAVFEFDVPAGSKVAAAHSHDGFEETIYGLEGTLVWTVEGQAHEVGSGEVLCIPRGAVHQFEQPGRAWREDVGDRDSGHPRPRVLSRGRRGPRCGSRRPSRPGGDRGSDAPPRTHPRLLMTHAGTKER
jgi:quercetin dioxygenase-like cupin family protein